MGLILWIDQNTFATGLLEKVFKKKELPFYTLPSAENFSYLVDDLKPVMIILDGKTAATHSEAFKQQYESSENMQNLPFVLVEAGEELGFIKNVVGQIQRPFDPFQIPDLLGKFLKLN